MELRIIKQSFEILTNIDGIKELQFIERVGRTCYKSEGNISEDGESAKRFVAMLIKRGHEAMLEHSILSVRFIVDRGISHEIVRHRIASYAQESTRYCNYSQDKFNNELTFIEPFYFDKYDKEKNINNYRLWEMSCDVTEKAYLKMLKQGATPQEARAVLPNSLKTELVMTANYREWRNFFKLRTAPDAHPQMREITIPLLRELKKRIPVVFDDIEVRE